MRTQREQLEWTMAIQILSRLDSPVVAAIAGYCSALHSVGEGKFLKRLAEHLDTLTVNILKDSRDELRAKGVDIGDIPDVDHLWQEVIGEDG